MLESLPLEILELILSDESVRHVEIAAVSKVSSRLKRCCDSNELWKTKFRQRWPLLCRQIESKKPVEIWRDLYRWRNLNHKLLPDKIVQLSFLYKQMSELPKKAFIFFLDMIYEHQFGYEFLIDELNYILNDGKKYDNLTTKYYAEKVSCYVKQTHLRTIWKEFMASNDQSIEKGAVLLAQSFQPSLNFDLDLNEETISNQLDSIAASCLEKVVQFYKDHPLSKMNRLPSNDQTVRLSKSLWFPEQCKQILIALNQTLFEDLGFCGNTDHYYSLENSYINRVLERKKGIPITLCIVYMCVARRLGVVCDPVPYPSHFLLRYLEHPTIATSSDPTLSPDVQYTYIDVFGKGTFLRGDELNRLNPGSVIPLFTSYSGITPLNVFERMIRNLIHVSRREGGFDLLVASLELMIQLRPEDVESRLLLCSIYINFNVNLDEVMSSLDEVQTDERVTNLRVHCQRQLHEAETETKAVKVHERPLDGSVHFAIGMLMVHKHYNYNCVIYGWDSKCSASEEWIEQMRVRRLPRGESQPFYHVIADDGSTRYAAEENLQFRREPEFLNHPEIGKYFDSFNGVHFVPNVEMCKEYPSDEEKLRRYVLSVNGNERV